MSATRLCTEPRAARQSRSLQRLSGSAISTERDLYLRRSGLCVRAKKPSPDDRARKPRLVCGKGAAVQALHLPGARDVRRGGQFGVCRAGSAQKNAPGTVWRLNRGRDSTKGIPRCLYSRRIYHPQALAHRWRLHLAGRRAPSRYPRSSARAYTKIRCSTLGASAKTSPTSPGPSTRPSIAPRSPRS